MTKEKLLPCPWCAEVPIIIVSKCNAPEQKEYEVACYGNGCKVLPSTEIRFSREDAIALWNKRKKK